MMGSGNFYSGSSPRHGQAIQHVLLVFFGKTTKEIDNFAHGVLIIRGIFSDRNCAFAAVRQSFVRVEVPGAEQASTNVASDRIRHRHNLQKGFSAYNTDS